MPLLIHRALPSQELLVLPTPVCHTLTVCAFCYFAEVSSHRHALLQYLSSLLFDALLSLASSPHFVSWGTYVTSGVVEDVV